MLFGTLAFPGLKVATDALRAARLIDRLRHTAL
jgi:hypothetical protein